MKLNLDLRSPLEFLAQEHVLQRLAQGVNLVLILLLSAALAELTWKMVPAPAVEAPPVARDGATAPAAGARPSRTGDVAGLHLFGTKPAAPVAVKPRPAVVPETRLQLTLRGVFASDDPATAGAIIAERSGKEAFYALGDKLPGGAVLKEVHADRIVLSRGGRLETLRMPREGKNTVRATPSARRGATAAGGSGAGPSLREYRDMVLQNPRQLADKVRIRPRTEGGRMTGYEIQPGRDAQFLSRFGLQPGDVVTAVNGITLNSPAKGLSVLRSLAKTDQVRVEILRNGVPQTIELDVNQ